MNYSYYFKRINRAVGDYSDNITEKNLRKMKKDIIESDEQESVDLVPIIDFIVEFINPLHRILCVIYERQEAENLIRTNWEVIKSRNYPLLTIRQLFDCMYKYISPDLAQSIIEKLDCITVVKSDMLQAIEDNDYQHFFTATHDNCVNYKFASDVCSYVTNYSKNKEKLENAISEINEDTDAGDLSFEDWILRLRTSYCVKLETIIKMVKEEGGTDDEIAEIEKNFTELFEEIISLYEEGDVKHAMFYECVYSYASICCRLHELALKDKLTPSEEQFLSIFYTKKAEEKPFVKGFLALFTKGVFLHEGFEFSPENVEDGDVDKLIDSCTPKSLPYQHIPIESGCHKKFDTEQQGINRYAFGEDLEQLPPKLKTDLAKKIFKKAIDQGFINITDEGQWEWEKKRTGIAYRYLAFMCGKIYCNDWCEEGYIDSKTEMHESRKHVWNLIDEETDYEKKRLPAGDLERLFGIDISQIRQNNKMKNLPHVDIIENLFESI